MEDNPLDKIVEAIYKEIANLSERLKKVEDAIDNGDTDGVIYDFVPADVKAYLDKLEENKK